MLEALRLWLNGNRDYWTGIILYSKCDPDARLIALMQKAKTDFTDRRLNEELLAECNRLKAIDNESDFRGVFDVAKSNRINSTRVINDGGELKETANIRRENITNTEPVNPTLYQACKLEADNHYKEAMNLRAVLFNMAKVEGFEDVNRPDLVQQRSKIAVDVVIKYQRASKLYDRASYVFEHGRLPNEEQAHDPESEMDAIPDELVKSTLDNTRKNFNKMKKREHTPERLVLLQQHEKNILKLEARWHLLKP